MTRGFTDDDQKKPVFAPDGSRIGRITRIHGDTVTLHREETPANERITDRVKALLGWTDGSAEHDLRSDQVDRREGGIYLRER